MTSRIHIKLADRGWILEKCALEIARRSPHVTYGLERDSNASIQYYINYSAFTEPTSKIELAFFTHSERDKRARERYFDIAGKMDACVCMSSRYANELKSNGIQNIRTFHPGVDLDIFRPSVRIGVIGRTYHTGRKGEALVAQVMDIPGIDWRFTGRGWPGAVSHVADADMPAFYNDLDYVLVPSLYEGGPMSALEGLACGKPIIASDVGWMDEFPYIAFENGNAGSLREVLESLVAERQVLRESVKGCTWDVWAENNLALFDELLLKLKTAPARQRTDQLHALLKPFTATIVSHGSESISRGGPTSRIANIVAAARKRQWTIDVVPTISNHEDAVKGEVVHVFNSWPFDTAITELAAAKERGALVVFSPIALNLSYLKYYQSAILKLMLDAQNDEQFQQGLETIHTLTPPLSPESDVVSSEGIRGHFDALRQCISLSDHIVYLSKYERSFLASINIAFKPETLIHNGVDAKVMAAGDAEHFRSRYGIKDFVLIVGRIESRKNQALVAYALRNLNVPIVCIGHVGECKYFELLKRWAGPNFVHIDRIEDRSILAGAYKAAICLVLTSWAEGAPLAALEAAAAGTPLLLSNMASEQEYFGEYAKYFHPCDIKGLYNAVVELIDNPETEAQRSNRSQMAVLKYDISQHADEMLSIYKSLQNDGPQNQPSGRDSVSLDLTQLAEMNAQNRVSAGVSSIELNLSRAILKLQPQAESIIWNRKSGGYNQTTFHDVTDFKRTREAVNLRKDFLPRNNDTSLDIAPVSVSTQRRGLTLKRVAISSVKETISLLPNPLSNLAVRGLKKMKKNFELTVLPEHKVFGRKKIASRVVSKTGLQSGDRLLLLGQPWISNERMLADLIDLVQSKSLKLWAYIPGIPYVTDAETFSDKMRSVTRERLLRLLRVIDTAIVTSNQAEVELNRFSQLHNLDIETKRIILGINEELLNATPIRPKRQIPRRFVLYVSSSSTRKRCKFIHDVWQDVLESLPADDKNSTVLIYIDNSGCEQLEPAVHQAKFAEEERFVLKGISNSELAWLYQNCLFTIYPPASDDWGMPPIESLAFGKTCIVSNSIPAAVETDCASLLKLPPNDYFAWHEMIKSLLTNEALLSSLSAHARGFIPPSWDSAAEVLIKA